MKRHGILTATISITLLTIFAALAVLPWPALAEDLEIFISKNALERFFTTVTPFKFKAELIAGQKADMTLSNPKLVLSPGQPGQVWVDMEYQAKTDFLGMPAISGQVKPEVRFKFDPKKGALQVTLHGVNIKGLPLDALVPPTWLPLTSNEPLRMEGYQIAVSATDAKTQILDNGLKLLMNYNFVRQPL